MSMRLSFCVKAVTSLDADDLETLTDGIEGYLKTGVDERQADKMALGDLQASVKKERAAVMALVREQHPDLFQTAAPAAAPPAAPEVVQNLDSEGNRIFKKGERVTLAMDSRAYSAGRSGVVSDVTTMRWKTLRYGGGSSSEEVSDLIYSYTVKTDGGAEFSARGDEMVPETGTPPQAVPDILINKRWTPPGQVLASIEYARQGLRRAEGQLSRAKVDKSKREHQATIELKRKEMESLQAAYDAWAKDNQGSSRTGADAAPVQELHSPGSPAGSPGSPTGEPVVPGLTLTKTRHTKTGADLWVVKMDGRVERAEYDRLAGLVRRNGGIWSKFTKGFNFATEAGARDFMAAASPAQNSPESTPNSDAPRSAPIGPEATFTPPVTPRVAATIVAPTLEQQDIDSAAAGRVPAAIVEAAKEANLPPADLAAAVGHAALGNSPPAPLVERVFAIMAADKEVQAFLTNPNNNEADVAAVLLDMAKTHTARNMGDNDVDFEAANELFTRWATPKIAGPELVQEMRLRTGLLTPTIPVQENSRDSTPSASQAPLNNPLDAGPEADGVRPDEPVRGARPPRARAGRADGGSIRDQGGLFEGVDDGGGDVGDRGGDEAVSDRPDDGMVGGGRRVSGRDFRPAVGGLKREGSWHAAAKRNLDLIDLARTIEAEGRPATPEEQEQLSKYVGFGASEIRNAIFPVPQQHQKYLLKAGALIHPEIVQGQWKALAERAAALPEEWQRTILQSTQYAHYTSEGIIRSVWSAVQRMGFTGGKIFEPGGGIGSFAMLMPDTVRKGSTFTGIEFDGPTALIARLLSPQQRMLHDDFIKRQLPDDFFDVSVGNPPFSQPKIVADPKYAKYGFMLHDYFFAKAIDKVRPGGLLAYVTSKGTMDKQSDKARKYLADRADFMGAVRLPSTAFEDNAGTSVVTDVIFLRKRLPGEAPGGLPWNSVKTVDTPDGPVVINEYFADNPDMVLGQNRISGNTDDQGRRINSNGMGGEKYTVVSYDSTPEQLDAKFAQAIERLPQNVYSTMSADSATVKREVARMDFDPAIKREGVVYVGKNGDLLRVEQGVGKALSEVVKLSDKDQAWLKSYVGLRDLVQTTRYAQVTDGDWESELKKLNKAYDAFLKKHGPINAFRVQKRKSTDEDGNPIEVESRIFTNRRLFREDYDAAIVTQLEVIDEDGNVKKGPFMAGRTIGKPLTRKVETIGDALAVSLDETGHLDLMDVARRMKITRAEAIDALGDQIYKTPQGQWQLADEFLSGNVVDKLEEAIEAAKADPTLERNIKALEAVQPEKLGPSQISVKLGAAWVDAKHVNDFAKEIEAGSVTFDIKTEGWQVVGGNMRSQRAAGAEFGTAMRSTSELLEAVLNSRTIKVMKREDKKEMIDTEATTAANEMAKKIKDKFKSWVWTDSERAADLVEAYNKRFNNLAPRRFDGSHLTLPGVSLHFKLHPHQLRAIWRQIQTGDTYLAHAVGAGKTIEMIAGGMEQKRLGLIRKPIYVVPNHMLEQFSNEFLELYPLANIMVADDQNFSKERRKAFVAAATLNAPDAIVITHDAFQRIGVKQESVDPIRDEILSDLEDELADAAKDSGARVRRSQLEQQIQAANQRFDRILAAGKKDGVIDFEDMGVDYVYVDEAHTYRKLDFHTAQSIKGIDPNGSMRSMDMYVKTRFLQKQRPGRAMTFASGTPVTNTMGELYTIMRFFDPQTLDEGGIATFDSWARMFGEVAATLEPNAAGKYETVERFAKFDNVPELMSRIRRFMDVLQSDQLGAIVKRPETEGGKPKLTIVDSTQAMRDYQEHVLQPRLEASRKWKPSKDQPNNPDPVIAIISDGRIAAADPRFIPGGRLLKGETTKLDTAADHILEEYKSTKKLTYVERDGKTPMAVKGGTQIVFYNVGFGEGVSARRGFSPRAALNKRLVDGGIKREEIAWFDDADTDAKKEAIFKGMRSGTLKVLIGSAKKMGTGVNVQNRLTALHYMDPPWYPADVEQPTGRIIRQGNQNSTVRQWWYATKGGYDSTMWQMVGRKQRFIDQAFSGDKNLRSMDDLGEASMYEQAAALASGDPRALQLAGLKQDVERLERLQAAHANEQIASRNSLRNSQWQRDSTEKQIAKLESGQKAIGGRWFDFKAGKVGQREYTKQTEFGQALKDAFNAGAADAVLDPGTVERALGSIGDGIKISMHADFHNVKRGSGDDAKWVREPNGHHEFVVTAGKWSETISTTAGMGADVDALGLARKIIHALNGIDGSLTGARRRMEELAIDETRLRKKIGAPFEYQQEMLEKHGELKELEEVLRQEGLATNEKAAPAPDAEQDGQSEAFDLDSGRGFPTIDGSLLDRNADGTQAAARSDREAAEQLQTLLNRRYPGAVFDAVAGAAGPGGERGSRERATVATIARRLFGHRVVFVRFGANTKLRFNGVVSDKIESTIFLNVEATEPLMSVLGHELVHRMRNTQPAVYEEFVKRLEPLLKNESRFTDKLKAQYAKQGLNTDKVRIDEELRADIVGDYFGDQEFWRAMAGEKPILFRRVVNAVLKFLDDIRAFLTATRPFGTQEYLKDIEAARKVVAASMGEFSQAQARDGGSEADGISFSLGAAPGQAQRRPIEQMVRNTGEAPRTAQDLVQTRGGVFDFNRLGETEQDRIRTVVDKSRPFWLGALTRDQIADIYGAEIPQIKDYDTLTRAMENQRSSMAQKADELYQEWSEIPADVNDRLARIMLDATVHQVHPDREAPPERATLEQVQAHARVRAAFRLMPTEGKAMYAKVRDAHLETLQELRAALEGRIDRAMANGQEKAAMLADLRRRFDQYLQNGPYFPLTRFGEFLVVAKRDADGERVVASYETAGEQQAAARALEADGFSVKIKTAKAYNRSQDGAAGKFIGDVLTTIEKVDMVEATINGSRTDLKNQLLDDINQLFIRALPDMSYRKHFAHRKNTPGFSADVMRGFASSAFHSASHIARLNHGDKMTFALDEAFKAIEQAPEGDFNQASQVLNEMANRHEQMLNPNSHPLSTLATQAGFVMYLGLSPAAGLINTMQVPMVALPYIGARYGFSKSARAMTRAYADIMGAKVNRKNGFNAAESPKLNAAERQAMATLQDEGVIDLTQAHDLAAATERDIGSQARSRTSFAIARAMKIVGWTFHVPEVMNRQVTALMAYRLELDKGGSVEAAMDSAREAIKRTQFDYSSSNRARYMQGNVARVLTQFKQFSQNMTYFLGRAAYQALKDEDPEVRAIARRQILATFAVTGAMAGSMGLPGIGFFGALLGMLAGALDDDDKPWDWKVEYRNLLADTFGKEVGEVLAKGVPRALMPAWDISGRVGLSDLWWRSNDREGQNPRESFASDMSNILGPTAGTVLGWYTAADHMQRGNYAKAAEAIVPKFIRDPIKAAREANEGITSYTGEPLLETTAAEDIGRILGFAPARASEMFEGRNAVKNAETAVNEKRQALLGRAVKARLDGDTLAISELQNEIAGFNRRNPEFKITGTTIAQGLMTRRRNRQNTEDGILLPKSKASLRDIGRFADAE